MIVGLNAGGQKSVIAYQDLWKCNWTHNPFNYQAGFLMRAKMTLRTQSNRDIHASRLGKHVLQKAALPLSAEMPSPCSHSHVQDM